jgi:hypothetical protein
MFVYLGTANAQDKCLWITQADFIIPFAPDSLSLIQESIQLNETNAKAYPFSYLLASNRLHVLGEPPRLRILISFAINLRHSI